MNANIVPIPDERDIPYVYTVTLPARHAHNRDPDNLIALERFLLHRNENMMVFASDTDLRILGQSEYVIGDGTFEMVPNGYLQLYTLHGFKNGEGTVSRYLCSNKDDSRPYLYMILVSALPLCHALLKNKQRESYVQLFTVIQNKIAELLQDDERIEQRFIFDFEMATHQAAEQVFGIVPIGCLFHFGQSIIRWIQTHGLKPTYDDENTGLKRWIQLVKALSLLPLDLVNISWNQLQERRPQPADRFLQQRLDEFAQYFQVM